MEAYQAAVDPGVSIARGVCRNDQPCGASCRASEAMLGILRRDRAIANDALRTLARRSAWIRLWRLRLHQAVPIAARAVLRLAERKVLDDARAVVIAVEILQAEQQVMHGETGFTA